MDYKADIEHKFEECTIRLKSTSLIELYRTLADTEELTDRLKQDFTEAQYYVYLDSIEIIDNELIATYTDSSGCRWTADLLDLLTKKKLYVPMIFSYINYTLLENGFRAEFINAELNEPMIREFYDNHNIDESHEFYGLAHRTDKKLAETDMYNSCVAYNYKSSILGKKFGKLIASSIGPLFCCSCDIPEIVIPKQAVSIFNLLDMSNIKKISNEHSGLWYIPNDTFIGSSVESIKLGNGVKYIGTRAFAMCKRLRTFEMPDTVEYCGGFTFESSGIESIKLSKSLKVIPQRMFIRCRKLDNVHIPYGVRAISSFAFSGCANLSDLFIPDSVQVVECLLGDNDTNTVRVHCSETVYNRCKDGAFKDKRLIPVIMGE